MRIEPGTAVGPYRVERRLAQGGMSVLFVARDSAGAPVVLKMVPPDLGTAAMRARLMREARALASVDHPGIVRIHGTGEHEGTPWIAMDYVRGMDLKRLLVDRGPLPVETALGYAVQAAEALAAAHDAGVIHRDLKPSNLLLTGEGRIVLADFGIAKRRADVVEDVLTQSREVLGTPAYLSPEQLEHGLADERSDIWALGCVLYEMVVGTPPFGKGGSVTTAAILRDEPSFPRALPAVVVNVITACLRKNSFARVASPRELLHLLRDALDDPRSPAPSNAERTPSTRPAHSQARSSAYPSSHPPARPQARLSSRPAAHSSVHPSRPPSMPPQRTPSSAMRIAVVRGRIKGAAIRPGISWFADTYGEACVRQVLSLASPDLRAMLREKDPAFGLMASSWYETRLIGELIALLEGVAAPPDSEEFMSRLSLAIARDNVGGIYRALFRLIASPALLEANAQRVWRTYVDEGTLAVAIGSPGEFDATVRGWSRHHPAVCRILSPMLESLLRAVGFAGLSVERTECIANGDAQCAFDGRWVP